MTYKVQKILSEIATRKLCTMDEHMAFYNDAAKEDYRFLSDIEELVKALQEEPVSEKKCMFTKDSYTDEDRKILCEDCKEKCEFNKEEHVTKDLGEYINDLSKQFPEVSFAKLSRIAVRVAKWKEQQLMANAVEGVVHHFEKCKVASVHYNDPTGVPMAYFTSPEGLSVGDKVKINVIKED